MNAASYFEPFVLRRVELSGAMFAKIATIGLMAFIATSEGHQVWDGYSAKWAGDPADGFYHLPQNLKDAEGQGWTEIPGAGVSPHVKAMGYFGDPRIILLFRNATGTIFGHQIGILVADIENAGVPINYTSNSAITKKILNGKEYFTATALYHEDERKKSRQIRVRMNNKFVEIPTKAALVTRDTSYYSKRCVPWMGHHYYKITPTTNCSEIFPWFLLSVGDDIIGIGFQAIGSSSAAPKRTWFENIPPTQQGYTIPDAPSCLGEDIQKYGVISFHLWFKKDPLDITCKDECTAVYNSTRGSEQPNDDSGKRRKRAEGSANVCPV